MSDKLNIIDFEEELKQFYPSLEIEELQEALYNQEPTDAVDVLVSVMQGEQRR